MAQRRHGDVRRVFAQKQKAMQGYAWPVALFFWQMAGYPAAQHFQRICGVTAPRLRQHVQPRGCCQGRIAQPITDRQTRAR
jgi:hypothetical protein